MIPYDSHEGSFRKCYRCYKIFKVEELHFCQQTNPYENELTADKIKEVADTLEGLKLEPLTIDNVLDIKIALKGGEKIWI